MAKDQLDRKQFDGLFQLYYKDLSGFVYSMVNDRETTGDLVHDLFFSLWKYRMTLDPERSIKSYLFTMARNHAFNYLKHQRVVAINTWNVAEEYRNLDEGEEDLELRLERVKRRMAELPDRQREVVIKCCVEGKMYREVAGELNISENTVKTHLVRAMKFLREGLREDFILFFYYTAKS